MGLGRGARTRDVVGHGRSDRGRRTVSAVDGAPATMNDGVGMVDDELGSEENVRERELGDG
jgi:hypothetical protein